MLSPTEEWQGNALHAAQKRIKVLQLLNALHARKRRLSGVLTAEKEAPAINVLNAVSPVPTNYGKSHYYRKINDGQS